MTHFYSSKPIAKKAGTLYPDTLSCIICIICHMVYVPVLIGNRWKVFVKRFALCYRTVVCLSCLWRSCTVAKR